MFGYYLNRNERCHKHVVHSTACGCVDRMTCGEYIGKFPSMRVAIEHLKRLGVSVRPCSYCGLHDEQSV